MRHVAHHRSPSLRGRGLKSLLFPIFRLFSASPSLRGRGLKWYDNHLIYHANQVALFTRAWIEIEVSYICRIRSDCRPLYEGVDWNGMRIRHRYYYDSRPLYEGVDWNDETSAEELRNDLSPSLRGRGLKSPNRNNPNAVLSSPSLRGRGLKSLCLRNTTSSYCVALFTRAWIEIDFVMLSICSKLVALFTRAWIEMLLLLAILFFIVSRPLYEGVDWNNAINKHFYGGEVALFTRAWIEILHSTHSSFTFGLSPSLRGRGLK